MSTRDRNDLVMLDRRQCLQLLRDHPVHVGRVGLVDELGRPVVLPVNYRLDGEQIVIRTARGSKLDAAARGEYVAFEVDDIDPAWEEGWSVVVKARAREVTDEAELERLRRLPLRSWAHQDRNRFLALETAVVTGRRIV